MADDPRERQLPHSQRKEEREGGEGASQNRADTGILGKKRFGCIVYTRHSVDTLFIPGSRTFFSTLQHSVKIVYLLAITKTFVLILEEDILVMYETFHQCLVKV